MIGRLMETKLLQLLRFKAGDVYSVSVGGFFGAEAPSREGATEASARPYKAYHVQPRAFRECPSHGSLDTVEPLTFCKIGSEQATVSSVSFCVQQPLPG